MCNYEIAVFDMKGAKIGTHKCSELGKCLREKVFKKDVDVVTAVNAMYYIPIQACVDNSNCEINASTANVNLQNIQN